MNLKLTTIAMLLLAISFPRIGNSQIFSSTNNTSKENASSVGSPNVPEGQVQVKDAPLIAGNKSEVINNLRKAGIKNEIIFNDRIMGNGVFSEAMSSLAAVKNTALELSKRLETAPTNGAIVISNSTQLSNNRNILKDNSTRTFVFRETILVDFPILVGSNKTIWIDGTLDYNGVDVVPEGGAAFTPRPLKNDGVFSIRHEGTFRRTYKPVSQENIDFNRNLRNNVIKKNRKANTTIRGTKRGKIIVRLSNVNDGKQRIPKANGIVVLSSNNVTIDGVSIEGALNAIYISGSFNVNVQNCFTDNSIYRGLHLHGTQSNRTNSSFGIIKNNFFTFSKVDGIDIDSFSAGFLIQENWIVGARDRLLVWTEIDANNNTIDNNVGVILGDTDGERQFQSGAYQENGTESQRRGTNGFNGTRENKWINNHSFYAEKKYDGFEMRANRFVEFNTITFTNNYVWTTDKNLYKHNPKANTLNDIYYLNAVEKPQNNLAQNIPFGQIIAIRKFSGDKQFLKSNPNNLGVIASDGGNTPPLQNWQTWERFIVEEHPEGGNNVVLRALSNNRFLQVINVKRDVPMRAYGVRKRRWERFEWRKSNFGGANSFGLRSVHVNTNAWMQCRPETGSQLFPVGRQLRKWETFTYEIISSSKELGNKSLNVEVYPNPIKSGNNINIHTQLPKEGKVNVTIYSIDGNVVFKKSDVINSGATLSINSSNLSAGVYLIKIASDDTSKTEKIIIK